MSPDDPAVFHREHLAFKTGTERIEERRGGATGRNNKLLVAAANRRKQFLQALGATGFDAQPQVAQRRRGDDFALGRYRRVIGDFLHREQDVSALSIRRLRRDHDRTRHCGRHVARGNRMFGIQERERTTGRSESRNSDDDREQHERREPDDSVEPAELWHLGTNDFGDRNTDRFRSHRADVPSHLSAGISRHGLDVGANHAALVTIQIGVPGFGDERPDPRQLLRARRTRELRMSPGFQGFLQLGDCFFEKH